MKGRTSWHGPLGTIGLAVLLGSGCGDARPGDPAARSTAADGARPLQPAAEQGQPSQDAGGELRRAHWQTMVLAHAPPRFRPAAWQDDQDGGCAARYGRSP